MEKWQLQQLQGLDLETKIKKTELRIKEWYEYWEGQVYISFSGGKDSTVLLDICRKLYPDIPAVFVDTGLEYPEIRNFVKTQDNVIWIRPEMNFKKVIINKGYPILSKEKALYIRQCQNKTDNNSITRRLRLDGIRSDGVKVKVGKIPEKWKYLVDAPFKISEQCCDIMKKTPFHRFERETRKKPYTGIMASESLIRERQWLKYGCNAFENKGGQKSMPLSFWTEQDVLGYLRGCGIPYCSVYGEILQDDKGKFYTTGLDRTGCMFCGFGCHLEKEPNRFQKMKETHPKQYEYCMKPVENGGLGMAIVLDFIGIPH